MITQCPKCKKIIINGRFIRISLRLIPGIHYRLCPECRFYINKIQSIL